jgi:hypothetical protein
MFMVTGGGTADDYSRVKEILAALGSPEATHAAHAALEEQATKARATHEAAARMKTEVERDKKVADELIAVKMREADAEIASRWRAHHADIASRNIEGREAALAAAEKGIEERKAAVAEQERKVSTKLTQLNEAARSLAAT